MDRDLLIQKVENYRTIIFNNESSEAEIDRLTKDIDEMMPNTDFTDIFYYGERDRTPSEMADEMIVREELFAQGGKQAVDQHIIELMKEALEHPSDVFATVYSAYQILDSKDPVAAKEYEHLIWPSGRPAASDNPG